MDIYILEYTQIAPGNQIEGFSVESKFFTDYKDALDEAYKLASEFYINNIKPHTELNSNDEENDNIDEIIYYKINDKGDKNLYKNGILVYNDLGNYCWNDDYYHESIVCKIGVYKNIIDLSKKIIMETYISG